MLIPLLTYMPPWAPIDRDLRPRTVKSYAGACTGAPAARVRLGESVTIPNQSTTTSRTRSVAATAAIGNLASKSGIEFYGGITSESYCKITLQGPEMEPGSVSRIPHALHIC